MKEEILEPVYAPQYDEPKNYRDWPVQTTSRTQIGWLVSKEGEL